MKKIYESPKVEEMYMEVSELLENSTILDPDPEHAVTDEESLIRQLLGGGAIFEL
jgi:hypothetical protein